MRNNYWVLYNYVRAEKYFNCNESITYTTHGDFTFMDNLEPLLERWQGPLSVAVYAPGSDLEDTIDTILYFRDCTNTSLVRDFTTFHLFFDMTHIPANIPRHETLIKKVDNELFLLHFLTIDKCYRDQTARFLKVWMRTRTAWLAPRTVTD